LAHPKVSARLPLNGIDANAVARRLSADLNAGLPGVGRLIVASVVWILFTVVLSVSAQNTRPALHLQSVRKIIEASFPETVGSDSRVAVTLTSSFNVEWLLSREIVVRLTSDEPQSVAANSSYPEFDQHLTARFTFARDHLEYADFVGRRVKSAEMAAVTAAAELHPEWQNAELVAHLEKIGAAYPADRKRVFVDALHLKRFEPALGRITMQDVAFKWRQGRPDLGAGDVTTPTWVVQIHAVDASRSSHCYSLLFEPIAGNLRAIVSRNCE
jgi:hypothetical protein